MVLLPVVGRYAVHWGLFDDRAGAWFSLTAGGHELIGVTDDDRAQRFPIPISEEALARAKAGLARRMEELEDQEKDRED